MAWLHKLSTVIVVSILFVFPPSLNSQNLTTRGGRNVKSNNHEDSNLIDPRSKMIRGEDGYDTRNKEFQEKTVEALLKDESFYYKPEKLETNGEKQTLLITYRKNVLKKIPLTKNVSRPTEHRKQSLNVGDPGGTRQVIRQRSKPLKNKETVQNAYSKDFQSLKMKTRGAVPTRGRIYRIKRDAVSRKPTTPLPKIGSIPSFLATLLPVTPEESTPQWDAKIGMAPLLPGTIMPSDLPDMDQETTVQKTPMDPNFMLDADVQEFGRTERVGLNSSDDNPNTEPEPWPEPGPDWSSAYMYLGVAWFIHIYGFAGVMFFIALGALMALVDMASSKILTSRGLSTSLNCLLLLFGLTRGISLVVNPYGSLERISLLASRLLWSVGFPCLTSMLTTLLLVLVDTTKVSLGPPKFQQFHIVMKLSVTHFIVVLGTDIILSFYLSLKALLLVCQLIYITWSILLTVGYYRVGYLISRNFSASRDAKIINDGGSQRLERLIFACGTVALCNCITHLYGAVGVFGVYSDLTYVPAWPWWVFQTLMRLEEICMCLIVLTLAGKSRRECNINSEDHKGLICSCWLKLKSVISSANGGGTSQIEPEDAENGQSAVGVTESWNTYGTNTSSGSSSISLHLQMRKQARNVTEETDDGE